MHADEKVDGVCRTRKNPANRFELRRHPADTPAMKNACYGLLLVAFLSSASSSDLSAQSHSRSAPPPLPAASTPPPVYFLTKGVWITIGDKAYGFGTGTRLELESRISGNRVRVRNGNYEFEVDRKLVTNDREVARRAYETEVAHLAPQEKQEMERKAAADAAFANRVADFKKDAADLLAKASLPPADFKEFRTLNDVQELPANLTDNISALAERARSFRAQEGYESDVEACRGEISSVSALEVRSKVAKQLHAGNAAGATVDINSFYKDNPSPPSDAQKDLWRSLASIRSICNRLEEESKTHLERAQSLSASGKSGEAIQEFQEAYKIFPDPTVAETIEQLREASLGL